MVKMSIRERNAILKKFKLWFKDSLIPSHRKNTIKLKRINEFKINPFLLYYLANYLDGNSNSDTLAKVLLYPRVLGTSINTSFGTRMQGEFITKVLGAYASGIAGLDIEFIDKIDGRKKYCQLKSGPDSINYDDVTTIFTHFKDIKNRMKINSGSILYTDLVFCLTYGEEHEKNSFIKKVEEEYAVYMGQSFWHRFTGDEHFYKHLIYSAGEVAKEVDMKDVVDDVIKDLGNQVDTHFKRLYDLK